MNKTDCIGSSEDVDRLISLLQELNPKAKVISRLRFKVIGLRIWLRAVLDAHMVAWQVLTSEYGKVPVSELVLTRRFDAEEISSSAGWVERLNQVAEEKAKQPHEHHHHHHHHHEESEGRHEDTSRCAGFCVFFSFRDRAVMCTCYVGQPRACKGIY